MLKLFEKYEALSVFSTALCIYALTLACVHGGFVLAASVHPPFPCWTCCPDGPLCSRDPDRISLRFMKGRATGYGNQEAAGTALSSSQWKDLATRVRNWQIEADGNGDMENLQLFVQTHKTALEAAQFNTAQFTPGIRSLGSTAIQAQLIKAMSTWTQAQRISYVSNVLRYGIDWTVASAINQLNSLSSYAEMDRLARIRGEILPPVRPFCSTTMAISQVWGFIAAVAFFTGDEPVAGITGLVAGTALLAYGIGGC